MKVTNKAGQEVTIIGQARGWYTIQNQDGTTEKVRAAALNIDNSNSDLPPAVVGVVIAPPADDKPVPLEMNPGALEPAPHASKEKPMAKARKTAAKTPKAAKAPKAAKPTKKAAKTPKAKPAKVAAKKSAGGASVAIRTTEDGKEYSYKAYGKTPAGHKSYDNGDKVAQMLRGKDIDAVYALTAKNMLKADNLKGDFAGCTTADGVERKLRAGLKDSNPGRQRMTLGNRLRAALRAIDGK